MTPIWIVIAENANIPGVYGIYTILEVIPANINYYMSNDFSAYVTERYYKQNTGRSITVYTYTREVENPFRKAYEDGQK